MMLAGARRYASIRGWRIDFLPWKEAVSAQRGGSGAVEKPLGFIVECGDGPGNLPTRIYGGAPAVFVNCTGTPRGKRFARIPVDNEAIGRAAFRELSLLRPPAFAVVDFPLSKGNWPSLRTEAFRRAAASAGAPCHSFTFRNPAAEDVSGEPSRLAEWLRHLPGRTAVFAVNDETSAAVVEAARSAHLAIPRDLAILGVDNNPAFCEAFKPSLSSIQVDFENAGFLAAKTLGEMTCGTRGTCGTGGGTSGTAARPASRARPARHASAAGVPIKPLLAVRRESTRGSGRREPNILAAIETIRREACDGLTPARLVSRFPGSRWLFEMRFREAVGHSVLDEILHVRLEKACALLASTDTAVGAIADFCGFGSPRALRAHFLSRIGMSMREFRARNRP